MRTNKEIDAEIKKLKKLKGKKLKDGRPRYNYATQKTFDAQIKVLRERMTEEDIEREWYVDETTYDYQDGDNELWSDACAARRWMNGEEGEDAPSAGEC